MSDQPENDTGAPQVAIDPSGVVHLSGAVQSNNTDAIVAILPMADRPAADSNFLGSTGVGSVSTGEALSVADVVITSAGDLEVYAPSTAPHTWVCLDGITFPAASSSLHFTSLHLRNGWVARGGSAVPSVAKEHNGIVHLIGAVASGSPAGAVAVLPQADRPAQNLYLAVETVNGVASVEITKLGSIYLFGASITPFAPLDGISFPAKGALGSASSIPFENGWHSEDSAWGTGSPAGAVEGSGTVHLEGSMATSGADTWSLTLPKALRPASQVILPTYTESTTQGTIQIEPDGQVLCVGAFAAAYCNLSGITFSAG